VGSSFGPGSLIGWTPTDVRPSGLRIRDEAEPSTAALIVLEDLLDRWIRRSIPHLTAA
jgi:hypothetical protein